MTTAPTVSVIICAYTEERWTMLVEAVESARSQTASPIEVIVSIDHNRRLFERAVAGFATYGPESGVPVVVMENRYAGRLGSARNTGAEVAAGDIIAFLDDDAVATPEWLSTLTAPYADPNVLVVGGAPLPNMSRRRPRWFPVEFDWVFGCVYAGLPTKAAPVRHLIGASMSVRREVLQAIGGFHSDNHDDMDLCHRSRNAYPGGIVLFEPASIVHHYVHPQRLTWRYFWRRCFFVNKGKVRAFRDMGVAGNLTAERSFVSDFIGRTLPRELRSIVAGDLAGASRIAAGIAGMTLAAGGFVAGTVACTWTDRRTGVGS